MKTKGFTLIELMIVVAIIAIIAAIAIPNLLRSRLAANESSAIGSLRTIASGEAAYQQSGLELAPNGANMYGDLTELGGGGAAAADPPFIDSALSSGQKSGYTFIIADSSAAGAGAAPPWTVGFDADAQPLAINQTGVRGFFVDESGSIRFDTDGDADRTTTTVLN